MGTIVTDPAVSSDPLAQERRLQQCLRALQTPGWEQRLQPLATHLATQKLVRARGYTGVPVRHLDLGLLREALSRLLCAEWEGASLIVALVVQGANPAVVAAERGVSRSALVEQLRDAVGALATRYERLANGDLNDWPVALGGKGAKYPAHVRGGNTSHCYAMSVCIHPAHVRRGQQDVILKPCVGYDANTAHSPDARSSAARASMSLAASASSS